MKKVRQLSATNTIIGVYRVASAPPWAESHEIDGGANINPTLIYDEMQEMDMAIYEAMKPAHTTCNRCDRCEAHYIDMQKLAKYLQEYWPDEQRNDETLIDTILRLVEHLD